MQKIKIKPDRANYNFKYGPAPKTVDLDGGAPLYRADYIGENTVISVKWVLTQVQYDYIMAFYRTGTGNGSLPFLIDLVLEGSALAEYTARFVPKTFGLTEQSGGVYVVEAEINVEGNPPGSVADQATIDAYPS